MRQRLSALIFFASVIAAMWSCIPEPLDVDDLTLPETSIVVSSLILPDSSVCVLLTKSIGALDANEKTDPQALIASIAINDAQVTIASDGESYPLEFLQDGVYQVVGMPLIPGQEYHLRVRSEAYGEVTASAVVQLPVYFEGVGIGFTGTPPDHVIKVSYSIIDPPSPNFYVLNVQEARRRNVIDEILKVDSYARIINDTRFEGTRFAEEFQLVDDDFLPGDSLEVSIANVSADYFHYVKLRLESNLELVELFSEPVYYPSNVRGGRGYFNLHWTDVRILPL